MLSSNGKESNDQGKNRRRMKPVFDWFVVCVCIDTTRYYAAVLHILM